MFSQAWLGGCDCEFVFLGTVQAVEEQGWETPRMVARRLGSGLSGGPSKSGWWLDWTQGRREWGGVPARTSDADQGLRPEAFSLVQMQVLSAPPVLVSMATAWPFSSRSAIKYTGKDLGYLPPQQQKDSGVVKTGDPRTNFCLSSLKSAGRDL